VFVGLGEFVLVNVGLPDTDVGVLVNVPVLLEVGVRVYVGETVHVGVIVSVIVNVGVTVIVGVIVLVLTGPHPVIPHGSSPDKSSIVSDPPIATESSYSHTRVSL